MPMSKSTTRFAAAVPANSKKSRVVNNGTSVLFTSFSLSWLKIKSRIVLSLYKPAVPPFSKSTTFFTCSAASLAKCSLFVQFILFGKAAVNGYCLGGKMAIFAPHHYDISPASTIHGTSPNKAGAISGAAFSRNRARMTLTRMWALPARARSK